MTSSPVTPATAVKGSCDRFNELGYLIASMSELWYGCSATGQVGGGVGGESKHDWHE